MDSQGAALFCNHCGKRWFWEETGALRALEGETEFDHIPDWFHWQRQQVAQQIQDGTYSFTAETEVFSLPRVWKYEKLGKAKLTHTIENGWELEGTYRKERYYINRQTAQNNSLHIEYQFAPLKHRNFVDISTENDSFYCTVDTPGMITKLGFATEELYLRSQEIKALTQ